MGYGSIACSLFSHNQIPYYPHTSDWLDEQHSGWQEKDPLPPVLPNELKTLYDQENEVKIHLLVCVWRNKTKRRTIRKREREREKKISHHHAGSSKNNLLGMLRT